MKKKPDTPKTLFATDHDFQGNYMAKLLEFQQTHPIKPGTVVHASILHDDWCALLARKGACNCDPDILFHPDDGEEEVTKP